MPAPIQPYPALYLYPLNDSFVPKHIALHNSSGAQQRVKIGRQTNAKSAPNERNGFFDSKVLSRAHAEVWEEGGKIFIKDVSSSNGTFINGERLSPEGTASEPFELKSDDIVEFGIDIVGEDNKTIIHHKVAARVVCVFTEQDVQVAARAEQHQQQSQQYPPASQAGSTSMLTQPGPSGPNANGAGAFNFAQGNRQQRPPMAQQGLSGMGGMGGGMRPPGKSGLTFDHILSRLQTELQKSRETGAELHTLTGTMHEINDTLGGNLPQNLPPYPSVLPPVRTSQHIPPQHHAPQDNQAGSPEQPSVAPSTALTASALAELQSQLQDTRTSLTSHVGKIHELEGALAEQETIKQEIRALREMMETRHQEMDDHKQRREEPPGGFEDEEDGPSHYDDDNESVATAMPHELERVEEEDEEQLALDAQEEERYRNAEQHTAESQSEDAERREEERRLEQESQDIEDEEERRRRSKELGRPRTPEPTNLGMRDEDFASHVRKHLNARASASSPLSQVVSTGTSSGHSNEMIEQVLNQVSALVALTSSLEAQHAAAQSTIQALETKVSSLEAQVKASQEAAAAAASSHVETQTSPPTSPEQQKTSSLPDEHDQERESLTAMVMEWKKAMEGQWSSVKEDWDKERERLNAAREQWEGQKRTMDSGLEKLANLQSAAAAAFQLQQQREQEREQRDQERRRQELAQLANGDLTKHTGGLVTPPSPRSLSADSNQPRRRKSGSRRGRSRSSRSKSVEREAEIDADLEGTLVNSTLLKEKGKGIAHFRPGSPSGDHEEDDDEEEVTVLGIRRKDDGAATLPTPSISDKSSESNRSISDDGEVIVNKGVIARDDQTGLPVQTALGVLVLGIAAAAVVWRVRPQS